MSDVDPVIPHVIHQTWKSQTVPSEFQAFQRSWIDHNPGFAYRFWTDDDIERFVEDEHPALLPVFRGYADPISRVDLARYLILRRFGGVYADLDFECLRPIDGLLERRSFLVGLEPEEHDGLAKAVERGLSRILCPSFLASVPGHPFWDHLLDRLVEARHCPDVLDATGPFLLTRALASYEASHAGGNEGAAAVTVLPPGQLYPVTKDDCWSGRLFDLVFWEQATRDAYAIHYWQGTWFRGDAGRTPRLPDRVTAVVTNDTAALPAASTGAAGRTGDPPLISCLMVTKGGDGGRTDLLSLAIGSFTRQSWPNKELVIVCDAVVRDGDGAEDPLDALVRAAGREDIRLVRVAGPGRTLGELRNIAVDSANGVYVCQWDDDDLYDPLRLEVQHMVLARTGAHACLLGRWLIWWPGLQKLAVSRERYWEGSLLCEKAAMPRYPHLRRGEDTPLVERLRQTMRVVCLDMPRLYTYVVHGANTFATDHFDEHWQTAACRFTGDRYEALLREMAKRLPIDDVRRHGRAMARPGPASDSHPPSDRTGRAPAVPASSTGAFRKAKVLVLTPVKDARSHLPRYMRLLDRLDHDPGCLSLGFLESDSVDGTHPWLAERVPALRDRYRRVTLLRRDYGFHPEGPRWLPAVQRTRREILARSRNRLLQGALDDEDWVLWLDVDLVHYPPDLLGRLLAAGRDIVTPHCVLPSGSSFDLNSFALEPDGERPDHMIDGLFQPPRGVGRRYLDSFPDDSAVPLDGVGGTALLVRADLHREGLCFPPYSHRGYIETEGLAAMAKDMGVTCWGLPGVKIVHADR
ncbi:glycosyltransferase [Azospirillum sp. B506]|uniref:glycosyltransferase n=1 Tax=Azospirillum sp. B506 TaxID=137721 RepID=UPI0005B2BC41|nr:glycosyltransferase [Azospirillum sp. B506]